MRVEIHAGTRNFIARHFHFNRLRPAFAGQRDVDVRPLGPLQHVRHFRGGEPVARFSVHGINQVARPNARFVGRRADERRHHHCLVALRRDGHAHAVVVAVLLLAELRVFLGVEEIGVGIQHVQHAGNRAVVDNLFRVHRLGVVLLHDGEHARKRPHRGLQVAGPRRRGLHGRPIEASNQGAQSQNHDGDYSGSAGRMHSGFGSLFKSIAHAIRRSLCRPLPLSQVCGARQGSVKMKSDSGPRARVLRFISCPGRQRAAAISRAGSGTFQKMTSTREIEVYPDTAPDARTAPASPIAPASNLPRIGIHTSTAGDRVEALDSARKLGANCLQIFSASPRMWGHSPRIAEADGTRFRERRAELGLGPVVIHANYLINLATPNSMLRVRSVQGFRGDLQRALDLGADFLVLHPGSRVGRPARAGARRRCRRPEAVHARAEDGRPSGSAGKYRGTGNLSRRAI